MLITVGVSVFCHVLMAVRIKDTVWILFLIIWVNKILAFSDAKLCVHM